MKLLASLAKLRSEIDTIQAEMDRLAELVVIIDLGWPTRDGQPVTARILALLRRHPALWFSPAEIMECTGIGRRHEEAVRKALLRLCANDKITRLGYGRYQAAGCAA